MRYESDPEKIKEAIKIVSEGNSRLFARALKVGYSTVLDWRNGRKSPTIENALKIKAATGNKITVRDVLPDYPLMG